MKILHVSPLYHPSKGGNQTHIKGLSEKLVEMGEDVTVFTALQLETRPNIRISKDIELLAEKEIINGVKIRRLKVNYFLFDLLFRNVTSTNKCNYWFCKIND